MLLPLPLILQSLFFQLAVADEHWWVVDTPRLTPTQFGRWFLNREVFLVIMEACGSAHQWARWLNGPSLEVRLPPAQYVRVFVKCNKTDAADAVALRGAARAPDMLPVRVNTLVVLHATLYHFVVTAAFRRKWVRKYLSPATGQKSSQRMPGPRKCSWRRWTRLRRLAKTRTHRAGGKRTSRLGLLSQRAH